ncbi:MAG: GntR family transcriptional regulator [Anaerolineae bacterium]|nr:GntR family transcriptional regulator [Anaerolineae bacterium]
MEIQVDYESGVPIYAQIMEQIKHLVAAGRLKPGDQLPTIRQLAVDLRVNPNTVVRAYHELDRQGVISTQQGRGTFIARRPDERRLVEMRKDRLRAIMGGALLEALSLGYEAEEIREAFEKQLEEWRRENSPRPSL